MLNGGNKPHSGRYSRWGAYRRLIDYQVNPVKSVKDGPAHIQAPVLVLVNIRGRSVLVQFPGRKRMTDTCHKRQIRDTSGGKEYGGRVTDKRSASGISGYMQTRGFVRDRLDYRIRHYRYSCGRQEHCFSRIPHGVSAHDGDGAVLSGGFYISCIRHRRPASSVDYHIGSVQFMPSAVARGAGVYSVSDGIRNSRDFRYPWVTSGSDDHCVIHRRSGGIVIQLDGPRALLKFFQA